MPTPITIPKASISMEEGTIVKWLLAEGDSVTAESLLFELETDKAVIDVPAPVDGVLLKILTPAGVVRVEEVVGWVGAPGESLTPPTPEKVVEAADRSQPSSAVPSAPPRGVTPSTPAARRRAAELGIEIGTLTGTGPNGRITQEDVELAAKARSTVSSPSERARGELGRILSHAWQTVPHIHISRRLETDPLAAWSERVRSRHISITDILLFTLSRVLPSMPEMTYTWRDERLEAASDIHIAFAVDTGKGVVAPVIRGIAAMDLDQISQRRRELSEAARSHQTRLADMNDAVFTLTNLGMGGADFFAPIVNWPQTAILATGRMTQEPLVRGGSIEIGWRMWANAALDHRAIDGAAGARFLAMLQDSLNHLAKEF